VKKQLIGLDYMEKERKTCGTSSSSGKHWFKHETRRLLEGPAGGVIEISAASKEYNKPFPIGFKIKRAHLSSAQV
jgi:hypothetical protein